LFVVVVDVTLAGVEQLKRLEIDGKESERLSSYTPI